MKRFLPLLISLLLCIARAEEQTPMLVRAGKVITQPDFRQPLGPEWSVAKGQWTPTDGVLAAVEIPDEKHVAVLHLKTGPVNMVVDCEFRFQGGKIFFVGCDGTRHVGRLVITEQSAKLAEDSTEVKGKSPSHVLAETKIDLKQGDWQRLHVEYVGDQMAARLNGQEMKVQHEYLATPKVRWWFAAGGDNVQLRNVRFSEGQPLETAK
ncbi:MAG: hypothetical protein QOE70_4459 [Chthoniobacter sp.]|jgi:hypothetical protein|nr:hypothetical protein [Chthoniobacter sp.]